MVVVEVVVVVVVVVALEPVLVELEPPQPAMNRHATIATAPAAALRGPPITDQSPKTPCPGCNIPGARVEGVDLVLAPAKQ